MDEMYSYEVVAMVFMWFFGLILTLSVLGMYKEEETEDDNDSK